MFLLERTELGVDVVWRDNPEFAVMKLAPGVDMVDFLILFSFSRLNRLLAISATSKISSLFLELTDLTTVSVMASDLMSNTSSSASMSVVVIKMIA